MMSIAQGPASTLWKQNEGTPILAGPETTTEETVLLPFMSWMLITLFDTPLSFDPESAEAGVVANSATLVVVPALDSVNFKQTVMTRRETNFVLFDLMVEVKLFAEQHWSLEVKTLSATVQHWVSDSCWIALETLEIIVSLPIRHV